MSDYNRVIMTGHLTRDPEKIVCSSGDSLTKFRIGSNRRYKKKNGEEVDDPCFIDCQAWRGRADTIFKNFKKGRPILVEGRMANDDYTNKEGQKVKTYVIEVERFEFINSNPNSKKKEETVVEHEDTTDYSNDKEGSEEQFDAIVDEALSGINND